MEYARLAHMGDANRVMRDRLRIAGGLLVVAVSLMAAAPAAAPSLSALSALEKGQWDLRVREPGGETRKLCLGDARQLLQTQHPKLQCKQFVIEDSATQVSVSYDCGAAGNGRTDLRVETPRLVQIQSQGVANGAPFSFSLEGRRAGVCHGR